LKLYRRTTKPKKYPRTYLIVRILYHKFMIAWQAMHFRAKKSPKAEQYLQLYAAKSIILFPFNSHFGERAWTKKYSVL